MPKVGQNPASVIAHRAWCEAQAMLLAAASGGPRTLALIGAAGTGKTWLLGRLVSDLRGNGRQVRLELRGDVSPQLPLGAVLLVDEASRLDQASLERMANQQRGLVILADVPAFTSRLNALPRPPATITLPTIDPVEVPDFIAEWAAAHDVSVAITDDAIARLVAHSGGTPRLITQLARAALALAEATGRTQIVGADIDEAAALKTGALDAAPRLQPAETKPPAPEIALAPVIAEPPAPKPAPAPPPRARLRWPVTAAIGVPVVAAALLAAWLGARRPPPAPAPTETQAALTPAVPADVGSATIEASPAESATTFTLATAVAPNLIAAAVPAPAPPVSLPLPVAAPAALAPDAPAPITPIAAAMPLPPDAPPAAPTPLPQQADPAPLAAASSPLAPAVAELANTPLATRPAPELTASLSPPLAPGVPLPIAPPPESAPQAVPPALAGAPVVVAPAGAPEIVAPPGAPGLAVLARPGDTLATLYAQIYRGHRPPSYAAVLAANPRPVRPGAIVVFPPPPDGWARPDAVTAGRDLP